MTHHFAPEFNGFRECNYCGDIHFIDDLDTDLLCKNCATGKCKRCGDEFKKSELENDYEHGELCVSCLSDVIEERANRFVDKMQIYFIAYDILNER